MADPTGRSGPTPPRYRVDGELTDQRPPKAERRPIAAVESDPADGRPIVVFGAAQHRPAFPLRPLDLDCVKPATLSAKDQAELVRLVRLVQTDFDPEGDPRGWDSVAVLVRGVGYGDDAIRRMGYAELAAIFRTSVAQMRLQKTGSVNHGIATNTSSIVSMEPTEAPKEQSRTSPCKVVLREWWDDPKRRQKLLDAGSAEKIGFLLGFGETTVKEAKPIWNEIKKHLDFRRRELRELEELRRAEEERLGG